MPYRFGDIPIGALPETRTQILLFLGQLSLPIGLEELGVGGEIRTLKLLFLRQHCLPLHHSDIVVGRDGIAPPVFLMCLIYSQMPSLLGHRPTLVLLVRFELTLCRF